MTAFWDLMSDRGGMGDGYIKWSAARAWADTHGFDSEAFSVLWYHLRELDHVFVTHQRSKT